MAPALFEQRHALKSHLMQTLAKTLLQRPRRLAVLYAHLALTPLIGLAHATNHNDVPIIERQLNQIYPADTTDLAPSGLDALTSSDSRLLLGEYSPHTEFPVTSPTTPWPYQLANWKSARKVSAAAKQLFDPLIEKIAADEKLDAKLLHAIIRVESSYDHQALSPKGAIGLMQLMPATASRFGSNNPIDPTQNIRAGARYLKFLQTLYGENIVLVLAAYNAGEGAVHRYNRRVPPFSETQAYISKVLSLYASPISNAAMASLMQITY